MGEKIGFIGTGVIASALVTGFCSINDEHSICVSPRNADRAKELSNKFHNVTVAASNQEVLDKSDWVVLSVVPSLGEEIIRPLKFRKDHRVINLMSDRKLPEIRSWIGETNILVHMVPLSFAAKRRGPIAIYPDIKEVKELFAPLGEIVGLNYQTKIEALAAVTGLMSSYYVLLNEIVNWGESKGLTRNEAADYTTSFFEALSYNAHSLGEEGLKILSEEMTKGGLNEMALKDIVKEKGISSWINALEPIMDRLQKNNK